MAFCYTLIFTSISNSIINCWAYCIMLINYTQLMFVNPNPKSWILIPALISAIFLLLYNFFRIKSKLKNDFLKIAKNVSVITNGFDSEVLKDEQVILDSKFTISYIGLLPKQSNPKVFFKVLKDLCDANQDFKNDLKMLFVGDISQEVLLEIEKNNLIEVTEFKGYVSHSEAIECQKKSQVLLLLIPNVPKSAGILTGKLFEYLTAKRPILALGLEDGDLAEILENTNAGVVIDHQNEAKLSTEILKLYKQFREGKLSVNSKNLEQYHRKNLTKQLAKIIKNL